NINARSLQNKAYSLESFLLEFNPHIVTITETWLHPLILDSEIVPPNYIILRKDRTTRGGGVAILLKRGIPYEHMPDVKDVESLWCKVSFDYYSVVVGVVYRPPNSDHKCLYNLNDYMQQHIKNQRIIMAGDFNIPEVNWDSLQLGTVTSDAILDILFAFNLSQIVREPTRVQGTSSSLLDLVFLSDHFPQSQVDVEVVTGISDHKAVICTIAIRTSRFSYGTIKTVLDFNSADDTCILTYLAHRFYDFRELCDKIDVSIDDMWNEFK
ncbi:uncharacterized protein LOC115331960, partial [Ixodes scapularis]|uniref:uncharacterized protein LOC115331960 n=1 Tax=Ixodes scapularis TaxID=6945 RepID=UPI001A9FC7BC